MRLSEIIRLVWINLAQNKTKVLLTSLGIIVGSATIVLVIAIGKGGQAEVADQFKNLNAGAIDIKSVEAATQNINMMGGMGGMGGGGAPPAGMGRSGGMGGGSRMSRSTGGRSSKVKLTLDDVDDLAELVDGLEEVTILVSGTTSVFGGEMEQADSSVTVVGVLENYQRVSNLTLLNGSFLSEEDNNSSSYVAVIGYSLAEEIFTHPSLAYGDFLTIDEKNYEVIGVLDEMGAVSSGISSDNAIYIPYNSAVKYIFGSQAEPSMTAVAGDVAQVEPAIENIKTVLSENYPRGNFSITDAGSAMDAATSSANTMAMLLLAVASIVFVVGGIGIMNVLFVSVQERTQEIGILKAIGCPAQSILIEFLLEAVFMGFAGGVLGIAVSFGVVPLIGMLGMRLETSVTGYLLALVFALCTGTVFGFYPAYQASKLAPIEALTLN